MDKIQFRPGPFGPEIGSRTHATGSAGSTARTMAERYAEVCRRSLPHFEPAEWLTITDALNGHLPAPHLDDWRLSVEDLILYEGGAKRHSVTDADGLLAKIRALSFAECVACLDLAERYWAAVGRGEDPTVPGQAAAKGTPEAAE